MSRRRGMKPRVAIAGSKKSFPLSSEDISADIERFLSTGKTIDVQPIRQDKVEPMPGRGSRRRWSGDVPREIANRSQRSRGR